MRIRRNFSEEAFLTSGTFSGGGLLGKPSLGGLTRSIARVSKIPPPAVTPLGTLLAFLNTVFFFLQIFPLYQQNIFNNSCIKICFSFLLMIYQRFLLNSFVSYPLFDPSEKLFKAHLILGPLKQFRGLYWNVKIDFQGRRP